jgi:predicted O-methyltransferase YrrM
MAQSVWGKVDDYADGKLLERDEALAEALAASAAAGLPEIDVSGLQGKFLSLMVRFAGARRILEIGTLGGYSTIWMARALPEGGNLVTIEKVGKHAEVARANIARAGLSASVDVREGAALEVLADIDREGVEPFDFVFIDADKGNNAGYLEWSVKLGRPGTVVVCDNVIRNGEVIDAGSANLSVIGSRAAFDFVSQHPRLDGTALQTVGTKGYDGMLIARVI